LFVAACGVVASALACRLRCRVAGHRRLLAPGAEPGGCWSIILLP